MATTSVAMANEEAAEAPAPGFRDLYEQHSRSVYLTALRVTGNPADAEDVLQTVFLRVFDGQIALDAAGAPGAYLRRAAANASIDILRRKKTRGETEIDESREPGNRSGLRLAGSGESDLVLKERLRDALGRIPAESAELFVLCYLEGYSYDELADLFQLERGTVASRLHRIRAKLQRNLSG